MLLAECAKLIDAGPGAVAEAEVAAFVNPADLEEGNENVAHKLFRGHARKSLIKAQHENGVDSGLGQQTQPLGQEREQLRRLLGIEELCRVRIEA